MFCVCSLFVPLFPFKSNTLSLLFFSVSNHKYGRKGEVYIHKLKSKKVLVPFSRTND